VAVLRFGVPRGGPPAAALRSRVVHREPPAALEHLAVDDVKPPP